MTQIILFILLATIIDLLLPNSTMKNYIKVVVGLLLILIFLKPVFYLFQADVDQTINRAIASFNTSNEEKNIENSIELKKKEIQASKRAYILEQMAVQMEDIVKEGLRDNYGVAIVDMSFQLNDEREVNYDSLEKVSVILKKEDVQEIETGNVDEVVIRVGDEEEDEKKETEDTSNTSRIRSYLKEEWQLQKKDVTIEWEGGVQ
ncbi:stage III sporulation protein AF [Aquibacillus sp. 3ASR75-11]|uniref:Stage III sporulation protein AF n=1 Tax=Terrihalobacillus insolitus TaxID=2950438 RepID=A0A9X3WSS5_9BACI|nr:stage III sporulation protein AF [Terrihalobacillus insolitus]MDC3425307.1 stage III sporulation protein AF [Terrihalobacillus insolitus]